MVSTQKKRQQNRRLLSHLDHFDQNVLIGHAVSSGSQSVLVNNSPAGPDNTVNNNDSIPTTIENTVSDQILEICLPDRIDREMGDIADMVEDRIEDAILTMIDNIITPRIDLAVRLINAFSGRDAAKATANQNLGNLQGSLPLLKTYPIGTVRFMK